MGTLRVLLRVATLTELWAVAPVGLLRFLQRRLGVTQEAAHEWLCPSLGCRCDD